MLEMSHWGASVEEINGAVVGDDLCPSPKSTATRCITLNARPDEVFPWIRQMGFGRAGWYSYDWIDNLGKKSATRIHPEWQDIVSGSQVPGGPIAFTAAMVNPPHSYVLVVQPKKRLTDRFCFALAYDLRDCDGHTRLVTRVSIMVRCPGGRLFERLLIFGDGIMVRRQLNNLAQRVNQNM